MKIKVNGKDLEMHYSMRSFVIYEEITGKSLNFEDITSLSAIVNLFYSNVLASMQYAGMELTLTYNEFWNYLDDNNGPELIKEFSEWYMKHLEAQADFNKLKAPKEENKEKASNKLKN